MTITHHPRVGVLSMYQINSLFWRSAPMSSTSSSDYGRQYRNRRSELLLPQGDPCPFCHRPMWPGQRLQSDHAVPRALGGADGALRWAHGRCNEAAGARLGNRMRARRSRRRWVDGWA